MTFRFGPVMQLGFVVPDIERAMQHWLQKIGLGPFFIIEHVQYAEACHRGVPTDIDMAVALAQWGEVQVELIQQRNDAPSIYTEFPGRKLGGLQHRRRHDARSCAADLAAAARQMASKPVQWGATGNGIRFAYVDTDAQPGGMIELIEHGPAIDGFFALVRDARATGMAATRSGACDDDRHAARDGRARPGPDRVPRAGPGSRCGTITRASTAGDLSS